MTRQITRSSTNGVSYLTLVWIAVSVMMSVMMLCISAGAPFWLTYSLSLGSCFLAVALGAARTTYTLHEEGMSLQYDSFLKRLGIKRRVKIIPWARLRSFRIEEKLVRSGELKKQLEIDFSNPTEKLVIYQGDSEKELESFFMSFLEVVERINAGAVPEKPKVIVKQSYYKTPLGRLLTIIFLLILGGVTAVLLTLGLFISNLFLVFLMIFAASYLVYRSFFDKRP